MLLYGIVKVIEDILGILPQKIYYPKVGNMSSFANIRYNQTNTEIIRDWIYSEALLFGKRKYDIAFKKKPLFI